MKVGPNLGLALVAVGTLLGCAGEGGTPHGGVARDSAGIRLIDLPEVGDRQTATGLSIDASWAPTAGLEIGDLLDLDVVPDRGVLILDELAGSVSLLSESGEILAVIGRPGQGPGEFNPQGLSEIVATDTSVFVPDLFLQRLTEFDFDGEVLGIQSFPFSPVYAVDWRKYRGEGLAFRAFEQSGDQIVKLRGVTSDTLLSVQISNDYGNLLLAPITLWDVAEDGDLFFARTDLATVERRRAGTGALVWRTRWIQQAEELDHAAVAHLEELVRERILRETPEISAELLAVNLASIQYPEWAPVVAGLMAAPGGDLWVRRARPVQAMGAEALRVGSAEAYGGTSWDILNRDGFREASVTLPDGFTPRRFVGEWIYGIFSDDLGLETAARVHARY